MDILLILVLSIELFLVITFLGVFLYLLYIYRSWKEPTIGIWTFGSLFSALALSSHGISSITQNENLSDSWFKIGFFFAFLSFWCWGIAPSFARRQTADIILIIMLTLTLGFILPQIIFTLAVTSISGIPTEEFASGFDILDGLYFLFFGIIYVIVARDSQLIYKASIKDRASSFRKSIAMTHLLAWHFWAFGTPLLRFISKQTSLALNFNLPFLLLLVPLLTLGSRPFDWAREGHEPVFLLLIDPYGTLTYSWMADTSSPLLMQGSTIATVNSMLENLVEEEVKSMVIHFKEVTLFTQSSNQFLSLLLTTGYHRSFEKLLARIHQVLVTDVIRQTEFGLPGYDIPDELKWLFSQLLPNNDVFEITKSSQNIVKRLLIRSGIKI